MISSLTGTVQTVALNTAVIDVNGFGMLVNATPGRYLRCMQVGKPRFSPPWWCAKTR